MRVIVVEDHETWRHFFSTALQKEPELQVIAEVSDGLKAVQKVEELQPDLILLDIGLPTLNGIEAARRIREVSPASKILFISENRSIDRERVSGHALRRNPNKGAAELSSIDHATLHSQHIDRVLMLAQPKSLIG